MLFFNVQEYTPAPEYEAELLTTVQLFKTLPYAPPPKPLSEEV